jgi:hypothetical protein
MRGPVPSRHSLIFQGTGSWTKLGWSNPGVTESSTRPDSERVGAGESKPPEMRKEFWDNLVKKRGTRDWKNLSETMVNVARHRGIRNKTRLRIEKSELIRLVSEELFAPMIHINSPATTCI